MYLAKREGESIIFFFCALMRATTRVVDHEMSCSKSYKEDCQGFSLANSSIHHPSRQGSLNHNSYLVYLGILSGKVKESGGDKMAWTVL